MVVQSWENWQRAVVCIECGKEHFPIRLSPTDMSRIEYTLDKAEREERKSSKEAAKRSRLPTEYLDLLDLD